MDFTNRIAKSMRRIGAIKCLFFVATVWGTPETTDFDVYHPMRTSSYLVKTTLPGGGNFANKLQPGYVYVWNGVKPRCALQKMMDSMIYNEKKFLKNIGKEKDPKPVIDKLQREENSRYKERYKKLSIDETEGQEDVRLEIIKRLKIGRDLCDFFTEKDKQMYPVDDSARVHLQKRIDAKTLMGPEKHVKALGGKKASLISQHPWFLDLKSKGRTVHPQLAKAYGFRRYVDRDCDHLLDIMPSYVDCIDGRTAETVKINDKGKMKIGVKYDGEAPISEKYRDLHKMTRLKKERVSMNTCNPSCKPENRNNDSIYHDAYLLSHRQDSKDPDVFRSILNKDLFREMGNSIPQSVGFADKIRLYGKKTALLSPMFMMNMLNWNKLETHMSDQVLAVRDWAPRNIKLATGELNPYWLGKPVNKHLYPVINVSSNQHRLT